MVCVQMCSSSEQLENEASSLSNEVTHKLAREIGFDCQDADVAHGTHICCCQMVSRMSCLLVSAVTGGDQRHKLQNVKKKIAADCSTCAVS